MRGAARSPARITMGLTLVALVLLAGTSITRAQSSDPDFQRVGEAHVAAMGVSAVGGLAIFLTGAPDGARWTTENSLDRGVRDALRATSRSGRESASTASDILVLTLIGAPLIIDAFLVTGLGRGDADLGLQLGLIAAEGIAFAFFAHQVAANLIGRERPYVQECASNPDYSPQCDKPDAFYTSFPSGHATNSAAAAGAICATHLNLHVWGPMWADVLACGGALAMAATVAALRVVADRHWFTDVLAGSALGLLGGWLLPTLLHFSGSARAGDVTFDLAPGAAGADVGLTLRGNL